MIKTSVVVKADPGFDGRPIALLVQEASQYARASPGMAQWLCGERR